jgi:VanZ family protein
MVAWLFGAFVSGITLFGVILMVSRVDRHAWVTFAMAVGVALLMRFWPNVTAMVRWLVAGLYVLSYLTWQIGPWLHIGDRIGVNDTVKSLVDRYDDSFHKVQLVAMGCIVVLLLIQWIKDRKRPWFSVWFVLVVAMGLLIIQYSGSTGAPGQSGLWLANLLHISPRAAEVIVTLIRKTIHFTFYGCLALFSYFAGEAAGCPQKLSLRVAMGYALMHAVYDEYRQSFAPGRTSSIWDVLLDAAGMALFLYLGQRKTFGSQVQV